MIKLYNTQKNITRGFKDFLKLAIPNIRKTQLKIIPRFNTFEKINCFKPS